MQGLITPPPPDDSALPDPVAVSVPIDASGSATAVAIRTFLFQAVIVASALVSLLGLGEGSEIVKWLRFFQSQEAIPVLAALALMLASGWQVLRGLRNHRIKQILSFFVPNRVAISPIAPTPAVEAAVLAATTVLEHPRSSPGTL
jgi:hypothetical protein